MPASTSVGRHDHRRHTVCTTDILCVAGTITIYEGPIANIPDEHASRRERFAELDELQPGWVVKLSSKPDGGTVDATFTSPGGALMPTATARCAENVNLLPVCACVIVYSMADASDWCTASGTLAQRSDETSAKYRFALDVVCASYAGSAAASFVAARRAALAAKKQAATEE